MNLEGLLVIPHVIKKKTGRLVIFIDFHKDSLN
jgi:hypothetical protein